MTLSDAAMAVFLQKKNETFQNWNSSIPGLQTTESTDGLPTVFILLAGNCPSAAPFWNHDPAVTGGCPVLPERRLEAWYSAFPSWDLEEQLADSLVRILPAGYRGRGGDWWSHIKPPTQKASCLSFFHNLDMWEWLSGMARFTNRINYYNYESIWWSGTFFLSHAEH